MRNIVLFLLSVVLVNGCAGNPNKKVVSPEVPLESDEESAFTLDLMIEESANYLKGRDFDGDGITDYMFFDYTGGAHCCYLLSLKLSTTSDTISYPFEMDGGYGFGIVDGSNQDQFCIGDFDSDDLPEIFMQISTYNGEPYEIYPEWTAAYGFTSNHIIFDYFEGEVSVSDYDSLVHQVKLLNR